MRVSIVFPTLLAEERHGDHPGHVEAGDAGGEDGSSADDRVALERGVDDLVLGPEPGEWRYADDGEISGHKRHEGDTHDSPECSVAAHVHVVVHSVHDGSGSEEEAGLEDTVGEEVEDRVDVTDGAETGGEHHVADLAHRGSGQRLLDVVLGGTDDRAHEDRDQSDNDNGRRGPRCSVVDGVAAGDQIDTGGDHGGRVDEGGHRCGSFHGIQQPGLQGELG